SSPKVWAAYHASVVRPRRRLQIEILRRGQQNGELREDVDLELVNDLIVGPMLLRTVMRPEADVETDLSEGLSEKIVDTVLEGLRPVKSSTT
ncbi:MAG: TetR/AcrR family transcriptional regulator C-terminal ligand-binding domain-containing protein, partial [Nonomuraea sp.]|nr:TetR/AcrR family transcriptional regulator C-terminal ligand-binding domain-containing protein [Nonomuraea sp.]